MLSEKLHARRRTDTTEASPAAAANLRQVSVFSALPSDDLKQVARTLRIETYKKRETILCAANENDNVYALLSGMAKVLRVDPETGKEIILYIVQAGDLFGLPSEDAEASSVAIALTDCRVAAIASRAFSELDENPEFANQMRKLMEQRLARIEHRLEELTFKPVAGRLAGALLRLAQELDAQADEDGSVAVTLTQQDVADIIGATREITSLTLNDFQRQGLVELQPGKITVRDTEALHEEALLTD